MTPHAAQLREALLRLQSWMACDDETILIGLDEARNEVNQALSLPSPSAWRDMADAPKDGTEIIGCWNYGLPDYRIIHWGCSDDIEAWYKQDGERISCATHFQPLPAPPETPRDK